MSLIIDLAVTFEFLFAIILTLMTSNGLPAQDPIAPAKAPARNFLKILEPGYDAPTKTLIGS